MATHATDNSSTAIPGLPPGEDLLARNWGWLALRGGLLVLLAVLALLFPAPALFAFATVFAAFCFVEGIFSVVAGVRGARDHRERWWALVLSGLLGIAVGVVFFFYPALGTVAYALAMVALVAGWAIATGILQVYSGWRLRRAIAGEWLLILSGAITVLLGLGLLALLWVAPGPTLLSVAWLIGIWAAIAGVALLVLAFRLRRHGGSDKAEETVRTDSA